MKTLRTLLAALAFLLAPALHAANITVNTFADEFDTPSGANVSLREAVRDAAASGDSILFAAGLNGGTITLTSGSEIVLGKSLTIDATGLAGGLTIAGGAGTNRIFTVSSGQTVALLGLTLRDGDGTGATASGTGGAIHNAGTLSLTGCTLMANTAGSVGGAIRNVGGLTATRCTFSGNTAATNGGAVANETAGVASFTSCTFSGNSQTAVNTQGGGAINHASSATSTTLTHCTFTGNSSAGSDGGGGIRVRGLGVTLSSCILSGNTTGGDVFNSTTITGTGANIVVLRAGAGAVSGSAFLTTVPTLGALASNGGRTQTCALSGTVGVDAATGSTAATDQRGFVVISTPDLGAYESNGNPFVTTTADSGAGSLRQALADAALAPGANTITFGPGFTGPIVLSSQIELNGGAGNDVTLDASALPAGVTLSGSGTNRIFNVGSGQSVALKNLTLANGLRGGGGAIFNNGTLTLTQCTLSGNSADNGFEGGGAIFNNGTLTLTQCSLSGNHADGSLKGGGAIRNNGTLTLTQCSLSGNHADFTSVSGGGGAILNFGALTLTNSIVAQNTATFASGPDISIQSGGTLTRNGVNFIGDLANTGGLSPSATLLTGNALLAPLGNYGGPTQTMALLPGSLARNATTGSAITSDQRGFAIFGTADLGAYEAQLGPIAATTVNEDAATGAMAFSVGNVGTLSASSGNTVLVPSGNIALGGSGPDRTLAATPAPDANGSATLTVTDSLSGETQTFVLTVTPVNDAPSFTKGTDIYVPNISPGAQAVGGWATAISAGPANESGQVLTFTVTNTNNALFSTQPAVAANGTLTFTPAASKGGVATVSVSLTDDATAGGPALTSAVQTFTIRVLAVTNSNNIGAGSLRQAVLDAAVAAGADTIVFAPGVTGPIVLNSEIVLDSSVTIDASNVPGGMTIDGGTGSNRVFTVSSGQVVTLKSLTLTGGNGGGGSGGAITNNANGTLALVNCTLSGNTAAITGGALLNNGSLTATGCTFQGNTAVTNGGAVGNEGTGAAATFTQCTFSGNTQTGINQGGGAINHASSATSLTLTHCTITGNSSTGSEGGGGIRNRGPLLTLQNSIVGTNTLSAGTGADINNTAALTRDGANIVPFLTNTGTLAGPAHNTSAPLLAPLGNYGGPTQTVALLPGSPARNAAVEPAIPNPSFEANTFTVFPGYASSNGGAIAGWTVSGLVGLNPADGSPFAENGAVPDGTNVAFLQSTGTPSTISTTLTGLTSGMNYTVSFRANRRSGYDTPAPKYALNGNPEVSFTVTPEVGGTNAYYPITGSFTATGPTAALVIKNQTGAGTDSTLLVDAFSVYLTGGSPITGDQRGFPIVGVADIGAYEAGTMSNFAAWSWEATGSALAFGSDTDLDGANAGLEYATRRNPAVSDVPLGPTLTGLVGGHAFTFRWETAARDLRYIVQRTSDLANPAGWMDIYRFTTSTGIIEELLSVTGDENETTKIITLTDPALGSPLFWRLRIEQWP